MVVHSTLRRNRAQVLRTRVPAPAVLASAAAALAAAIRRQPQAVERAGQLQASAGVPWVEAEPLDLRRGQAPLEAQIGHRSPGGLCARDRNLEAQAGDVALPELREGQAVLGDRRTGAD